MHRIILSMLAPARRMRLVIQKPVLASGNRPTAEIRGRSWLRSLVLSPLSHLAPEPTEHTGRAMRSSAARSARSLLIPQTRPISTCPLHAGAAVGAQLPAAGAPT